MVNKLELMEQGVDFANELSPLDGAVSFHCCQIAKHCQGVLPAQLKEEEDHSEELEQSSACHETSW